MTWSGVSYLAADLTAVYGAALATAFSVIRFLEWARNRPRVIVQWTLLGRARADGVSVSEALRASLEAYADGIGEAGVMIPLTPHYRAELARRLHGSEELSAILKRFIGSLEE